MRTGERQQISLRKAGCGILWPLSKEAMRAALTRDEVGQYHQGLPMMPPLKASGTRRRDKVPRRRSRGLVQTQGVDMQADRNVALTAGKDRHYGNLVQSVERPPHKRAVSGSNPRVPTIGATLSTCRTSRSPFVLGNVAQPSRPRYS